MGKSTWCFVSCRNFVSGTGNVRNCFFRNSFEISGSALRRELSEARNDLATRKEELEKVLLVQRQFGSAKEILVLIFALIVTLHTKAATNTLDNNDHIHVNI